MVCSKPLSFWCWRRTFFALCSGAWVRMVPLLCQMFQNHRTWDAGHLRGPCAIMVKREARADSSGLSREVSSGPAGIRMQVAWFPGAWAGHSILHRNTPGSSPELTVLGSPFLDIRVYGNISYQSPPGMMTTATSPGTHGNSSSTQT